VVDEAAVADGTARVQGCSSASSTKPAWAVRETRQPMMRLAKASMMKAT
jgi:hypothetical protein